MTKQRSEYVKQTSRGRGDCFIMNVSRLFDMTPDRKEIPIKKGNFDGEHIRGIR